MSENSLSHIVEPLRNLAIAIDTIAHDPGNVRKHSLENLAAIKGSLSKFGQRLPIVIQKQGMVVRAGNGRLEAARLLGWKYIAAIVVDETDVDATAYALADNRTAELAEWDDDKLIKQLMALSETDFDLGAIGFDQTYVDALRDGWAVPGIDLDGVGDYVADDEVFVVKVESVTGKDKDLVLALVNEALNSLGYVAKAF